MLKDSQPPRYAGRRTHRTYSAQFKVDLVAACLRPGASIASLALQHGMNANVLHRWLKEHNQGRHRMGDAFDTNVVTHPNQPPAFIPIPLATSVASAPPEPSQHMTETANVRIECQRGDLSVTVTWPLSAISACAKMLREVLR
jgi:transposase-like protein